MIRRLAYTSLEPSSNSAIPNFNVPSNDSHIMIPRLQAPYKKEPDTSISGSLQNGAWDRGYYLDHANSSLAYNFLGVLMNFLLVLCLLLGQSNTCTSIKTITRKLFREVGMAVPKRNAFHFGSQNNEAGACSGSHLIGVTVYIMLGGHYFWIAVF